MTPMRLTGWSVVGMAVAVLALPAAAAAEDAEVALTGPAAQSLRASGVGVGASAPAALRGQRLALPTAALAVDGDSATVRLRGAIRLRAGRRGVALTDLRVTVGPRSSLSAEVDGRRRTIATIDAGPNRRAVGTQSTYITRSPLTITPSTLRLLRRSLDKPRLRGGRLGTVDLETTATPTAPPASNIPGAPPPPTVTGPPTPGGPSIAKRPTGAVSITTGTVSWAPRTSWLGYLASGGPGSGPTATDGAAWQAATSSFTLPVSGGWYDPARQTAVVKTTGSTRFVFPNHAIDIAFANWTYDLASAAPKAVATITAANGDGRPTVGSRPPLGLLKPTTPPTISPDAKTITWTAIPMTLSAEGVPIYRAYLYGSDQGTITITATTG